MAKLENLIAQEKLANKYEKEKAAKESAAKAKDLVNGVGVVGKGATTFAEIGKWLADNPDAQYFRIDNGGSSVNEARSYVVQYGDSSVDGSPGAQYWSDNDAAIVWQSDPSKMFKMVLT